MAYQCINLQQYQNFDSISEMDNTVKQFNVLLKKSHYETLNLLKQFSCKVIGVSHIKVQTIAKQLGKSVATIKRHLKYLKENGFISIINTFRQKTGGKGANAYVINSVEYRETFINKNKNELSEMSYREDQNNTPKARQPRALGNVRVQEETINSLKLLKSFVSTAKRKSQQYREKIEAIKNYRSCPKNVPQDLYKLNSAYFSDKQIASIYKVIHRNVDRHKRILTEEQIRNIYYDTFKSIVTALKKYHKENGREVKNVFAYANTASQRQIIKYSSENAWNFGFKF